MEPWSFCTFQHGLPQISHHENVTKFKVSCVSIAWSHFLKHLKTQGALFWELLFGNICFDQIVIHSEKMAMKSWKKGKQMNKGMTSILYSSMFVFTNVWDLRFISIYLYIYIYWWGFYWFMVISPSRGIESSNGHYPLVINPGNERSMKFLHLGQLDDSPTGG